MADCANANADKKISLTNSKNVKEEAILAGLQFLKRSRSMSDSAYIKITNNSSPEPVCDCKHPFRRGSSSFSVKELQCMVLLNAVRESKGEEEESHSATTMAQEGDALKEQGGNTQVKDQSCLKGTADNKRRFAVCEEDHLDRSGLVTLLKDYRVLLRLQHDSMM